MNCGSLNYVKGAVTCGLACALLLVPGSARAQAVPDTLSVAARLVMQQPTGVRVRVLADNMQHVGLLERADGGLLYLSDPPQSLTLHSIDDAWLQRRSTGRGAKVGAIVGGATGAVLFTLGALVLSATSSTDVDGAGDVALAGGFGAVLGGGSGFLVGALIGSGISRWERITESSAPPVVAAGAAADRSGFSSFTVTPSVTRLSATETYGFGASVAYLPQLTSMFALGPEVAMYGFNTDAIVYAPCVPDEYCPPTPSGGAWSVAGLARIGPVTGNGAQPYALLGLGLYRFPIGDVLGGYSAGAGMRWNVGSSYAIGIEGRWHSNATNPSSDEKLGFITAGLGLTLRH